MCKNYLVLRRILALNTQGQNAHTMPAEPIGWWIEPCVTGIPASWNARKYIRAMLRT